MGAEPAPPPWLTQGNARAEAVQKIFGTVAPSYDRVNAWMSLGRHQAWRRAAVRTLALKSGDNVLDICCGTGDFLPLLRKAVGAQGRVIGLDFARPMLVQAQVKEASAWLGVADALRLPVPNACLDGITIGWGLRNICDPKAALVEFARVLKPGRKLAVLEMARPEAPVIGPIADQTCRFVIPRLGRLAGYGREYDYLMESTARWMTRQELTAALEQAGFEDVRIRNFMFGNICLHTATRRSHS